MQIKNELYEISVRLMIKGIQWRLNPVVATVTERALQWRTNRMIDDEYHDFIASNLHLRVQIKIELYEMSVLV